MAKIRLAIVGLGKIARDQHLPALAASDAFELVGVASPHNSLDSVPSFKDLDSLLDATKDLDAVSLCTTPQVRFDIARKALDRGLHVLLEKPPGATVSEVNALGTQASRNNVTLFASWHSRHAAAVEPAREWLANRKIRSVTIHWKEGCPRMASRPGLDLEVRWPGGLRSRNQRAVHPDAHSPVPARVAARRAALPGQLSDAHCGRPGFPRASSHGVGLPASRTAPLGY